MEKSQRYRINPQLLAFVKDLPAQSLPTLPTRSTHSRSQTRPRPTDFLRESLTSRDISHRKDIPLQRNTGTDLTRQTLASILTLKSHEGGLPIDFETLRNRLMRPQEAEEGAEGGVSGRKEAELLAGWLDYMLEQAAGDKEPERLYERTKLVYDSCFRELVKQIHSHCWERGEVLNRIWKGIQGLSSHQLRHLQQETTRLSSERQEALRTLAASHQSRINDLQRIIYDREVIIDSQTEQIAALKGDLAQAKNEVNQATGLADRLRFSLIKTKRKLYQIREDQRLLSIRIKNQARESSGKGNYSPIRYKPKSIEVCKALFRAAARP